MVPVFTVCSTMALSSRLKHTHMGSCGLYPTMANLALLDLDVVEAIRKSLPQYFKGSSTYSLP